MSLSYQPLEPVLVKDPRTIIDNKRVYSILKAGKRTTFKPWTSTSVSAANINFQTPPPSSQIIVDRKITFTLPMRLTFTATVAPGFRVFNKNYDAPRAFPIHSMLDTIQLTINNCGITQNIGEIIHALLRFNTDRKLFAKDYSMTPTCLDQSQSYGDLIGHIRNPLAMYGDSNFEDVTGRGGFSGFKIVANPKNPDDATAPATLVGVIDMICTEQIMLSPLYWGGENASGFANVTSMDWVFNFLNQGAANRAWSHYNDDNVSKITGSQVQFNNLNTNFSYGITQPYLNITYITPDDMTPINPQMPITYPYFSVDKYVTDTNTPLSYGSANPRLIQSNNIQLASIPRRIYIYARPSNSYYYSTPSATDCYYQIDNLSIQFENYTGLFANATPFQLYEMSKKNHCNMSWSEWSGQDLYKSGGEWPENDPHFAGPGSIICVEFASDIGLDNNEAPGLGQGTYNLQLGVTIRNVNNSLAWDDQSPSLYVIVVLEGSFTITNAGSALTQTAIISTKDVLEAKSSKMYNYLDVQEVNGGNFMSGLKNLGQKAIANLGKANKFLKDTKLISRAANIGSFIPGTPGMVSQEVSKIADYYGYGKPKKSKKPKKGGVVLGGKKMSKNQLQNRLKYV